MNSATDKVPSSASAAGVIDAMRKVSKSFADLSIEEQQHGDVEGAAMNDEDAERSASIAGDHYNVSLPRYAPFYPMDGDVDALQRLDEFRYRVSRSKSEYKTTAPQENTWSQPPAGFFIVRGPDYISQVEKNAVSYKQPSAPAGYDCIGVNVFESEFCLNHVCEQVQSIKALLAAEAEKMSPNDAKCIAPQYLVTVFHFSNWSKTEFTAAVHIFKRRNDILADSANPTPAEHVWKRFMSKKTDAERNEIVKFMCRVVHASPALHATIQTLGGERPVIIGRKLTTGYKFGKNYLEINHDVGSSQVASMLCGVMLSNSGSVVFDYAWLLEGQKKEECPEQIMGICRWNWCTLDACAVRLDAEGNIIPKKE